MKARLKSNSGIPLPRTRPLVSSFARRNAFPSMPLRFRIHFGPSGPIPLPSDPSSFSCLRTLCAISDPLASNQLLSCQSLQHTLPKTRGVSSPPRCVLVSTACTAPGGTHYPLSLHIDTKEAQIRNQNGPRNSFVCTSLQTSTALSPLFVHRYKIARGGGGVAPFPVLLPSLLPYPLASLHFCWFASLPCLPFPLLPFLLLC
jgi:hypothetical protein